MRRYALSFIAALSLTGCALFSADATPQEKLNAVHNGVILTETTVTTICGLSSAPKICLDAKFQASYAQAIVAEHDAEQAAQDYITANGNHDADALAPLIADCVKLAASLAKFVADLHG